MAQSVPITISYGDSPEMMDAALDLARDSGAVLEMEVIASGLDLYRREIKEGIMPEIYESLKRTGILLKSTTHTPKEEGYISVTESICQKLEIDTCLEYYVSDVTAGIGLVVEKETAPLRIENIVEIYNLTKILGGESFCYTIDELGLMLQQKQEKYPDFKIEYKTADEASANIKNYDVIFTSEKSEAEIKKVIAARIGCKIFSGNGFRIFEPIDNLNPDGKGLILAIALAVKYAGQTQASWQIYKSLAA